METIAELRGVTKRYGQLTALDGFDLSLARGQMTALLGQNGAGKTTAVRLLLGLTAPTAGQARLFGRDPRTPAARQRVGVMLQVSKVPETLTVAEHIRLFSIYYRAPLPLAQVVGLAGLSGLERRRFAKLSGGERQRLFFAIAIAGNPDLLVLDEPTVGLDVESRRAFWRVIREFVGGGRSVLLTTHYIEEADALADRVVILQRGRVIADGRTLDIKRRVAGRLIRCVTRLDRRELAAISGVVNVSLDRRAATLLVTDAESAVKALLAEDATLSDLEVTQAGLEDAFLALVGASNGAAPTGAEDARVAR